MNNLPTDIITYIGNTHLNLKDIVHWQSINKKWQLILSNIIWSDILFNVKIIDTDILRSILSRHKFRKVNLNNTMIKDDFAKLLSHCYEISAKNCFHLTDKFVLGLKKCHSLDIMRCFNIRGSFLKTKSDWRYLNVNGCYQFELDYLKNISAEPVVKAMDASPKAPPYRVEEILYDINNEKYFNVFDNDLSYDDIFRGYSDISDSDVEGIISKYIVARTEYIKAFLSMDSEENFRETLIEKTQLYGLEIMWIFEITYRNLKSKESVFRKQIYFSHPLKNLREMYKAYLFNIL